MKFVHATVGHGGQVNTEQAYNAIRLSTGLGIVAMAKHSTSHFVTIMILISVMILLKCLHPICLCWTACPEKSPDTQRACIARSENYISV